MGLTAMCTLSCHTGSSTSSVTAYIVIQIFVHSPLTVSALNPSILIVTTVMTANWIARAVSKPRFSSNTADIVQENGSSSLAIESTWNSNSACGKMVVRVYFRSIF